jgi:type II secretory pathway pseudopilin PulG
VKYWAIYRHLKRISSNEDGISVVEMVVAVMLMVIAASIYLGAMTSVYSGVNLQQRRSEINDEARAAIQQLDREVRSGNFISVSETNPNYRYDPATESFAAPACGGYSCEATFSVRIYTQANATTRTPPQQCVQYLITGSKLLRRSWSPSAPYGTGAIVENWRTVATDIVNRDVSPTVPAFSMEGPGSRVLNVTLVVNNRLGQADAPRTVRITSSVAMRNYGAGDPCTPIPTS